MLSDCTLSCKSNEMDHICILTKCDKASFRYLLRKQQLRPRQLRSVTEPRFGTSASKTVSKHNTLIQFSAKLYLKALGYAPNRLLLIGRRLATYLQSLIIGITGVAWEFGPTGVSRSVQSVPQVSSITAWSLLCGCYVVCRLLRRRITIS